MKSSSILEQLIKEFPDCWFKDGREFDNSPNRIVWSGEGSSVNGEMAFSYQSYEFDASEKLYTMGVLNELNKFCTDRGYYWEAYNGGTYFLYKM